MHAAEIFINKQINMAISVIIAALALLHGGENKHDHRNLSYPSIYFIFFTTELDL